MENIEWKNKIRDAMDLLKEACQENKEWSKCQDCPFNEYCKVIIEADLLDPSCEMF